MSTSVGDVALSTQIRRISKEETLELRQAVLWPHLPILDVRLPEDDTGIHYGAFHPPSITPIAVISLFVEDLPSIDVDGSTAGAVGEDPDSSATNGSTRCYSSSTAGAIRFRKFACSPEWQGKGVGTRLLLHALSMARVDLGVTVAWCDARTATQEWYRKRGFVAFGPTFFKKGVEYVRMRLDLAEASDSSLP